MTCLRSCTAFLMNMTFQEKQLFHLILTTTASSREQLKQELEPDADVVTDGFTVNESDVPDAKDDIDSWLDGLGY